MHVSHHLVRESDRLAEKDCAICAYSYVSALEQLIAAKSASGHNDIDQIQSLMALALGALFDVRCNEQPYREFATTHVAFSLCARSEQAGAQEALFTPLACLY